jgi:hypothetical protein
MNHPYVYNIVRMKSMRNMNRMHAITAAIPWASLLREPAPPSAPPPPARCSGRCPGCSAHTVNSRTTATRHAITYLDSLLLWEEWSAAS